MCDSRLPQTKITHMHVPGRCGLPAADARPPLGIACGAPRRHDLQGERGDVARGATGERSEQCAAHESRLAFGLFGCRRRRGREN